MLMVTWPEQRVSRREVSTWGFTVLIAVLRFFSSGISVILVFMCGIVVSSSPAVYGFASFG